jgi:hypothetical protein
VPVIVGEAQDVHVQAVTGALADTRIRAMLISASSLETKGIDWMPGRSGARQRGWIRRLANPGWRRGVLSDSHDAAVRGAWMAGLIGDLLTRRVDWLTPLYAILAAENKLTQLATAHAIGLSIPRTKLTSEVTALHELGERVVVKPLGAASFIDADGGTYAISATPVDLEALDEKTVRAAPFLFQEVIHARSHLRVVTVQNNVWVAELAADGLPLDWREDAAAHDAFQTIDGFAEVRDGALALATKLRVGYSSQDWVVALDGQPRFLDLNPAGQWLFLPPEIADNVTAQIAGFLAGQEAQ